MLLRDRSNQFHRHALAIALAVAGISALLQPISGDHTAKVVAETQPVKLAAREGQFKSERCAPLRIGGLPDPATETTHFALEVPYGLSFLAHNDFNAEVKGLDSVPPADRRCNRPDLGGQPCLAHPGGGNDVHRLPASLCSDHDRAAHSAESDACRTINPSTMPLVCQGLDNCWQLIIARKHARQALGIRFHQIGVSRGSAPDRGCRGRGRSLPPPA
jgi:cytochrome bd-type quinol oxidase subunit 1